MNIESKQRELADLKRRAQELEAELRTVGAAPPALWPPPDFYASYYAMVGAILGILGALVSLLANVVLAPLAGKSPLELIKVYLTFPLGERALSLTTENGALALVLGSCLYIATGMVIGVPIYLMMSLVCGKQATLVSRLLWGSIFSLLVWVIAFYGILSWLQPLLFGGNWVTDPAIMPPWVAAGTHLLFGWTLAVLYPWGQFTAYQTPSYSPPVAR